MAYVDERRWHLIFVAQKLILWSSLLTLEVLGFLDLAGLTRVVVLAQVEKFQKLLGSSFFTSHYVVE